MIHKTELVKDGALWVLRPKQPEPEPQPLYPETEPKALYRKLCLWNDIFYAALLEYEGDDPYRVEMTVYATIDTATNGNTIYRLVDTQNDTTTKIEDAEVYMHGWIKWDECSDMHFDDQDCTMIHFCGREHIACFCEMLHRLYDEAGKIMEREEDFKR